MIGREFRQAAFALMLKRIRDEESCESCGIDFGYGRGKRFPAMPCSTICQECAEDLAPPLALEQWVDAEENRTWPFTEKKTR